MGDLFERASEALARRWLAFAIACIVGLALVYLQAKSVVTTYQAAARVLTVVENSAKDAAASSIDLPTLATSTVVIERAERQLHITTPVATIKKGLSARILARSSLMEISYRDASKDLAVSVPNAVAEQLSSYYAEISTQSYDREVAQLDAAIARERTHLSGLTARLQAATSNDPSLGSDKAFDDLTTRLGLLETDRGAANATLVADQAAAGAGVSSQGPVASLVRSQILQSDALYRKLRDAVATDEAHLAQDRAQYTADYPGLAGEISKVESEHRQLDDVANRASSQPDAYSQTLAENVSTSERSAALVAGDRARVSALDRQISSLQTQLHDFAASGSLVSGLRAERDASTTQLTSLSTRRAEAAANRAEAYSLGFIVVVDRAVLGDTETAGGKTRFLVIGAILVAILAGGVVWLLEFFDPRLRRRSDVESLYGAPVVANFGARMR